MLLLTPHAFFAWRVTFVASGLARCISLPLFRLHPFPLLFSLFVKKRHRAAFLGGVGKLRDMGNNGYELDGGRGF